MLIEEHGQLVQFQSTQRRRFGRVAGKQRHRFGLLNDRAATHQVNDEGSKAYRLFFAKNQAGGGNRACQHISLGDKAAAVVAPLNR
ncbi:hypothetical protein D3C73_1308400 [compost metagenome]